MFLFVGFWFRNCTIPKLLVKQYFKFPVKMLKLTYRKNRVKKGSQDVCNQDGGQIGRQYESGDI